MKSDGRTDGGGLSGSSVSAKCCRSSSVSIHFCWRLRKRARPLDLVPGEELGPRPWACWAGRGRGGGVGGWVMAGGAHPGGSAGENGRAPADTATKACHLYQYLCRT